MEDISKLVENFASTFQQCLLTKDPVAHTKSLPESLQKNLLLYLLQPHSQQFKEVLKNKYQLRGSVLESIDKWKVHSKIVKASKPEEIKYLIEKFLKENHSAYNYAKPAKFHSATSEDKSETHILPSQLKPLKSLHEWASEQIQKNEDIILSLSKKAVMSLSEERLLKLKATNKEQFLNLPYIKEYSDRFAVAFVNSFNEQMIKLNKNYEIPTHIFYNLSKTQFMSLKDAIPSLINKDEYLRVWFSHSYDEKLQPFKKSDLTISQKDEKRKVLLSILKDLEHLKTNKTKSLRRNLLKELILLDISREEVDKDFFVQYIRDNPNSSSFENQKQRQRKYEYKSKSKVSYQDDIDLCLSSNSTGQDQIIQDCLQRLFKKQNAESILKQLQEYFEVALLNKVYAAVKLSEGGKLQDYQNYLSAPELKQLRERRQITILDSNKRKWKVDDLVTLKVRVKNINDIHVQVYKLDLQKHFAENTSEIDQTQNLSYLQPNHSYHYTTDSTNPYLTHTYDIKIEGVPQGRGVWIVELEGEGISSRAFIRKGAIANTSNNNTAGTELKFYDESGNQVKDYNIWMEGKKHNIESSFTIPYGESDKNLSLVITKDGYAERFNVYVPRESYYIDMAYIYNSESFIVGSIAKILLHPRLNLAFDRNMDINFRLLEKLKILVTLTNNLGIKSTVSFDNVQFKSTEDYVLEFPVQSFTSRIEILITGKVKKYNGKQEDLTSGHTIDINLAEGNTNFLDLYMRKKKDGYYVYLLGKNGEPVPRTEVIVQIQAEGRTNDQIQNLMTYKDGSVGLGSLSEVEKLTVKVNLKSGVVIREWNLNNLQAETDLLEGTVHLHGQEIVLPPVRKQKCQLWRVLSGTGVYTENHNDKVTFEQNKVSIKGLAVGSYLMDFLETDRTVSFTVIQGKAWENQNKIYDENQNLLYQIDPHQNSHISLGDATFKNQEGKTIVQIPVKATYDIAKDSSFRAHLMASNFILPNFKNKFDVNITRGIRQPKYQTFVTKQSEFYNNKKLSEESSYVVNRGKQKKYIGNNLQKPKVFLKRIEVRDTTQSEQVLDVGGQYAQVQRNRSHQLQDRIYQQSACPPFYGRGYAGSLSSAQAFVNQLDLTTHNNFLNLPGTISSNKKSTTVIFELPAGYSHFQCCAFNRFSGIVKSYDLALQDIDQKSLSHTGIQTNTKDTAWTMSREVYKAQKGQNVKVGRDSVWSAVGVSNVISFAKIKGATLQDWVGNWSSYSEDEKLKIYDEKVCHELNTYIKYNDRAFFDKIIQPFIRNKVTKTFVDWCLLESEQALKWTTIDSFQQLNEFQKVLLVHQLVKAGRKEEAKSIAASMENFNKANRKTFEQFKKQFDTVITAKLTQQAQRAPASSTSSLSNSRPMMARMMPMAMSKKKASPRMDIMQCQKKQMICEDDFMDLGDEQFSSRGNFNQPFKQMQKTKQYTETTYSKLKYAYESKNLVQPSPFWASAAQHFANGQGDLLTENFMYLTTAVEFTLACCFIPNQKLLQYNLKSQNQNLIIEASSSFLIFVREVKQVPFEKKFGVLINQRFFNPDDRYYYEEDGTRIEKETDQFIVRRPYCVQTLITNTSGTKLELQLLIDIPEGSVPLRSHQNTQIQSINLQPYSTLSFERFFYFPHVGSFSLYPANACRGGLVIAKADEVSKIEVLETETVKKLDTLENVLKSGQQQVILQYLETKNIFDSKIFEPSSILWMLKDKNFFSKAIQILRSRKYYLSQIWMFGYYHSDLLTISQFEKTQNLRNHENVLSNIAIFEYFPYYSSRAHKFLNENKSTIRNQQFKKTYFCFLFASLFNQPTSSRSRVAFIYYLLLQDRIDEAQNVLSQVEEPTKQQHRLQFDYIECFIDMYKGYPTFAQARKIAEKYVNYPVKSWQKMFKQIADTLKEYDSVEMVEQKKKIEYSTTVLNEGTQLRISIPADTRVEVNFYDINLELFFSNFPFTDLQSFCSNIIPNSVKVYEAGQSREQKLIRNKQMKDCFVQVYSSTSGLKGKKVSSFLWSNPNIKIKIKEDSGYAQVFCEGKRQPGCYCKVYQMKNGQNKFYRDGYTDITGTFKYALADLEGVSEFSILFVTDQGGIVQKTKPPSQQAYLA